MSGHATVFAALVVVAAAALVSNRHSVRIAAAALLLGFQAFVLLVSFDSAARSVIAHGNENSSQGVEFERGARALKDELLPFRFLLIGSGVALTVLVLRRPSRKGHKTT